ncbi:hypothetical protein CDAR_186051 [Caerostris darwini]|uniref:Uncharacterized protein n=1 Tax=Caerostris darwini TaxID=1538125 RepID=A0AAV4WWM8_9ARAC|nr:hypothetical protein CDAR_186051 [Caerostris darwini]
MMSQCRINEETLFLRVPHRIHCCSLFVIKRRTTQRSHSEPLSLCVGLISSPPRPIKYNFNSLDNKKKIINLRYRLPIDNTDHLTEIRIFESVFHSAPLIAHKKRCHTVKNLTTSGFPGDPAHSTALSGKAEITKISFPRMRSSAAFPIHCAGVTVPSSPRQGEPSSNKESVFLCKGGDHFYISHL